MARLRSAVAADTLAQGLGQLADIVYVAMPDSVARLEPAGGRPILYLDAGSPAEDLAWAMMDALRALALGADAATSARTVPRRLHSVPLPRAASD
jgi:hypothetical protein